MKHISRSHRSVRATKTPALVRVAMQFLPAVGKKLSEGFVAHDEMGNCLSFFGAVAGRRSNSDEMDEAFLENHFEPSNKKCRLHDLPSLKNQGRLDHGVLIPETIESGRRTAIGRDGFRKLSVAAARTTPPLGKKPAKGFVEHGHPGLNSGLCRTVPHFRQIGPKDEPHKNLFGGLDLKPCHEEAGERFRLGEVRQIAVSVVRHFLRSRLNSNSRVSQPNPRDGRSPWAGMVGLSVPFDMAHHSFSSARSLHSPTVSVAGNGDSNERLQSRGFLLQGRGFRFRAPERRPYHV